MNKAINTHHYSFGELKDYLTGNIIPDTLDERYRQKIAILLVEQHKFQKRNIKNNIPIIIQADSRKAKSKIDFLVQHREKIVCLIKFAPGSLVTRRLSSLALSRILVPYQIPFIIVTNGEDAEILDGDTGRVIDTGLSNIPSFQMISHQFNHFSFQPVKDTRQAQASRIAYACEVDGSCPCDTDICIIEQ